MTKINVEKNNFQLIILAKYDFMLCSNFLLSDCHYLCIKKKLLIVIMKYPL